MQAIILAAGMGRRLGELTRYDTKCMIEVNGIRIIHLVSYRVNSPRRLPIPAANIIACISAPLLSS